MMDDDDFRALLESPVPENQHGRRTGGSMAVVAVIMLVAIGALAFLLLSDTGQETSSTDEPPTTTVAQPSTTKVTEAAPVFPGPRFHAEAAIDDVDQVFVLFGGQSGRGLMSEGTWLFDFESGSWRQAAEGTYEPLLRVGHAMTYVDSLAGSFLYGGGTGGYVGGACSISYCPRSLLADTWLFETETATWRDLNPGGDPGLRYGHAVAYDSQSDVVVLFGGIGSLPPDEAVFLGDTWVFDPAANTWHEVDAEPAPAARAFSQLAHDPLTDRIYMFGGMAGRIDSDAELWAFDVDSEEWELIDSGSGPTPRWMHQMDLDVLSGSLYVYGGHMRVRSAQTGNLTVAVEYSDEAWFFDLEERSWQAAPTLPGAMFTHVSDSTDSGVVAWVGGGLYRYESVGDEWVTLAEPE